MTATLNAMPQYRSHKEVWALKIASMSPTKDGGLDLSFVEDGYGTAHVSPEYVLKHQPQVGGYYVVYADGYESWSPADAFEQGYTRI